MDLVQATEQLSYKSRLSRQIQLKNSILCAGIDPSAKTMEAMRRLHSRDGGEAELVLQLGLAVLDAAQESVPAIKLQSAYFEALGPAGFAAMAELAKAAKARNIIVIWDAKRGDIASTMEAYGATALAIHADAMTINPYMGLEVLQALEPQLRRGFGVYVVWVTSNASAAAVQDLRLAEGVTVAERLYRDLAAYAAGRDLQHALGLVVGATRMTSLSPAIVKELASVALLVPGVGAQGGELNGKQLAMLHASGASLVNVSRGITDAVIEATTWTEAKASMRTRVERFRASLACADAR